MKRLSGLVLGLVLVVSLVRARAEQVQSLPAPTGYVNDFAGVLRPDTVQSVNALCRQVDQKAHAQIAVVTVKTIEANGGGETSVEEFATALEEKWKVGAKGTDKGVLMLLVMNPRRGRIEVGYGLEGILNDAKVGDIGRLMAPAARQNDYDTAVSQGVAALARVIATDAGVTLQQPEQPQGGHRYHQERGPPATVSPWKVMVGGAVLLLVLIVLISTGNAGWIFLIVANMMGGGGGGRDEDDRRGGGFGGFGGGSSGGGGASGDF